MALFQLKKSMLKRIVFTTMLSVTFVEYSLASPGTDTTPMGLLDYQQSLVDVCNSGTHNRKTASELTLQCLKANWQTIQKIQKYCEQFNCKKNALTVTDYNKFAQDETAKELVQKVTQSLAKSEQDSVVLESKMFCQMQDSLLASKGWLKVMERMGIDTMFELYPTYKTGLIQSIESSSELWKSNCIN